MRQQIQKVIDIAWNNADPSPDNFEQLADGWEDLSDESREHVISVVARVMEAITEPQDEWELCESSEIRKGDRFKVEGAGWSYEGEAVFLGAELMCYNPITGTQVTPEQVDGSTHLNLYRIPTSVLHPDPEVHPVIVNVAVKKPGTDVTHRYEYATWDAADGYNCWKDGKYYGGWEPSTITDWAPAKVVPAGDQDA